MQGVRPSQLLAANPASTITITRYLISTLNQASIICITTSYKCPCYCNVMSNLQVSLAEVFVCPSHLNVQATLQRRGLF